MKVQDLNRAKVRTGFREVAGVTGFLQFPSSQSTASCASLSALLFRSHTLDHAKHCMQIVLTAESLTGLRSIGSSVSQFVASARFIKAPSTCHPARGKTRLALAQQRAAETIGMVDFEPDEPETKRARLDLEDGTPQPLPRERTIVAPPPSTSKALKSVLKGGSSQPAQCC